jgi:hypothetical protein
MSDTYTSTSRPDLAGQAKNMARDLKAKASDVADVVTRAAKDNASQMGDAALDMAKQAKDKAEAVASRQKSAGADYIDSIAQAASRAANEFESELPQAARYIRQASEQIQGVANNVRERDMRELVGEVQEFARRQPTLFFGGALILGFAALRFLKSSAPGGGSDSESPSNAFEARRAG